MSKVDSTRKQIGVSYGPSVFQERRQLCRRAQEVRGVRASGGASVREYMVEPAYTIFRRQNYGVDRVSQLKRLLRKPKINPWLQRLIDEGREEREKHIKGKRWRHTGRGIIKHMGNRGSVDIQAWLTGLMGFVVTYMLYILFGPTVKEMMGAAASMALPAEANSQIAFTEMMYNYGMVFLAGGWLVYIIYSSIRKEVAEKVYSRRYY